MAFLLLLRDNPKIPVSEYWHCCVYTALSSSLAHTPAFSLVSGEKKDLGVKYIKVL